MKGTVNILVLGKENVGKTAVIVRYLTGRYLTEYAHAAEMTYERNVVIEGRSVPVKIIDVSGKNIEQRASNKDLLNKVDGIVIMYSVTDHHSFVFAEGICEWLRREKKQTVPIVLLGNKDDLCHMRCVKNHRPATLEWHHESYLVTECSASTDAMHIVKVFNMLISKILEKSDAPTKHQRKLSQNPLGSPKVIRASLRRRFSVFSRERTSTM